MAEPTDAEMIAWCEHRAMVEKGLADNQKAAGNGMWEPRMKRVEMYRAIAARLRETAETPHPNGHGPA